MAENRLDLELFERKMCKSRERAKQLIKSGKVSVDGKVCLKPSAAVSDSSLIRIDGDIHCFVGRGGLKLKKAVEFFDISLCDAVCLDIGASTGGFTDCMLQNGAAMVYALDVGHSQLDQTLLDDPRVVNMEKTNIRESVPDDFDRTIDFIATDVSFISLKLVLPKIKELLSEEGSAVVLIKPQFEAGKTNLSKNGIVKNPRVHRQILEDMIVFAGDTGFEVSGLCVSPIKGGSGNAEYLMYLKSSPGSFCVNYNIDEIVNEALRND
ncbi:MAG: TlyA family RNA methyltransferase [Ruminococcus sp.]|nr:TlyA family RNA methyltransferase [Ruminococcus sp.]